MFAGLIKIKVYATFAPQNTKSNVNFVVKIG